jgi:hypothetical protein
MKLVYLVAMLVYYKYPTSSTEYRKEMERRGSLDIYCIAS